VPSPDQAQAATPILALNNLTVALGGSGGVRPVEGVDLSLEPGELLCLVGESGCGKSMTALAAMGLLPEGAVVSGSIRFDGVEMVGAEHKTWRKIRGDRIGMVFQEPMTALNPVLTVGRQVAEVLEVHRKLSRREAMKEAVRWLDRVGIDRPEERAQQYPGELSGGMRQRVLIAGAIACSPQLLIADEPTTALDVTIQAQILDLIRQLQREEAMATLFITHDFGGVAEMADRVAVMYAGLIVESGPVAQIFDRPLHPYTRALQACHPRSDGTLAEGIPGSVPRPGEAPDGCRFRPRCPHAVVECEDGIPWREYDGGQGVRCIRPEAWLEEGGAA